MSSPENPQPIQEGKFYHFLIINEIAMPPDDEPYFVLETESGSRQLLLKSYYEHYHLKTGMTIRCKVDKVNCSGKIFLEPDHPWCKPGDLLDFEVTSTVKTINSLGTEETLLMLTDPWGVQAYLSVDGEEIGAYRNKIQCRVERIKKGKLLISDPARNYFGDGSNPLPDQPFLISGVCTLSPNLEFYTLKQRNSVHYLRTKYFDQYGLHPGDEIPLRVLSEPILYHHYLEPLHPFYTVGETYSFDFLRTEKNTIGGETNSWNLVIKDALGHEYSIAQEGNEPQWVQGVTAVVQDIRMSKCIFGKVSILQ